jgi:hypothetical protein
MRLENVLIITMPHHVMDFLQADAGKRFTVISYDKLTNAQKGALTSLIPATTDCGCSLDYVPQEEPQ